MNALEREVLRLFLAGLLPALSVLRAQANSAECESREETAGGLTVTFAVPADAPRLDRRLDTYLDDVLGETSPVDGPLMFVLWINAGRLAMLEGTAPGRPWPMAPDNVRLSYVEGDRNLAEVERAVTWFPIVT